MTAAQRRRSGAVADADRKNGQAASVLPPTRIDVRAWLRAAREPWVVYSTLVELEGRSPEDTEVRAAYKAMAAHPQIRALMGELDPWPPRDPLSRAYDPKDSIWALNTLADFGLRRDDKRIAAIAGRILDAQAENGGFLHGGFDHTKSWHTRPYICISHVMTYALARFGYLGDARVAAAYTHIERWQRLDGGWHPNERCLPGGDRESEPSCPFGTVNVLRAVIADPARQAGAVARKAAAFLLNCWERRDEPYRPVKFGIGSTWNRLQYPFVQYQMLKTMDALSQVPSACRDARFRQMLDRLEEKRTPEGLWVPEGVNKPFAEFDFGQKKQPSAWVTFLAARILKRGRGR